MPAPYITPAMLTDAATGVSWNTIPTANATLAQQLAAQLNICRRATSNIDGVCGQQLRATLNTQQITAPGRLAQISNNATRITLTNFPVLSIEQIRISPSQCFPPQWSVVPAGKYRVEAQQLDADIGTLLPGTGAGPATILMAPGYVSWQGGRDGWMIEVEYINGWPNTLLTQAALAGDTVIHVDETIGWLGNLGHFEDGGLYEDGSVVAVSADSGPGTLTLSAPIANAHAKGVLFTAMPEAVHDAAIKLAQSQAIIRGATATAVPVMPGRATGAQTGQFGQSVQSLIKRAYELLIPYRRLAGTL